MLYVASPLPSIFHCCIMRWCPPVPPVPPRFTEVSNPHGPACPTVINISGTCVRPSLWELPVCSLYESLKSNYLVKGSVWQIKAFWENDLAVTGSSCGGVTGRGSWLRREEGVKCLLASNCWGILAGNLLLWKRDSPVKSGGRKSAAQWLCCSVNTLGQACSV